MCLARSVHLLQPIIGVKRGVNLIVHDAVAIGQNHCALTELAYQPRAVRGEYQGPIGALFE